MLAIGHDVDEINLAHDVSQPCGHRTFNSLDVIPAQAGIHPEMIGRAVAVERHQDGSRPAPG
ncbi:hypothetical protein D3C72_2501960 [compost metagenome]